MNTKNRHNRARQNKSKPEGSILYGLHSVSSALQNQRRHFKALFATKNAAPKVSELANTRNIEIEIVSAQELGNLCEPGAVHQGVVAKVSALPQLAIQDIKAQGLVVFLDQVTDPHNVGAILRSCAAFNVQAVVVQDRHSPQNSQILAKTASGALEFVPIIEVVNLSRAMDELKQLNFTFIGLDSEAEITMGALSIPKPLALVLGAEGKGLRQKTRQNCDLMARLDMPGQIKSLNVSNAAAICLYSLHTN